MLEPLDRLLSGLPTAQPDPERSERIRLRCRAQFARQAPRQSTPRLGTVSLWQPAIAALGVVYLIAAIVQAMSILN